MKRLLTGALALILSAAAQATTLNPIQLLNPTGSTSGQAIVSTGAGTAPGWANVDATTLAAIAANAVIANVTASSASPTAFVMPSCAGSNSALKYTNGTGFTCGASYALTSGNLSQFAATTSAQLAGIISDETGSGSLVFGTSPTIGTPTINTPAISGGTINSTSVGATTPNTGSFTTLSSTGNFTPSQTNGIVGTTTNNSANAGSVGEVITASVVSGSAVSVTNGTAKDITSISLTAGDWDVWGQVVIVPTALTTVTGGWLNTVSATQPTYSNNAAAGTLLPITSSGSGAASVLQTGIARVSISGTTTYFLSTFAGFASGTCTAYGYITARRRR